MKIDWKSLDSKKIYMVSGSAFINVDDPYGPMGNPFTVIIGDKIKDYTQEQCKHTAKITGTPETIFIRDCHFVSKGIYDLRLTVLTPTGKELGACAHGFTGAIKTLLEHRILPYGCKVKIQTTIDTHATIFISSTGIISLEFKKQKERFLTVPYQTINNIFDTPVLLKAENLSICSVGSPKLIIEVTEDIFMNIQEKLSNLNYQQLLAFEDKEKINGIHIFSRNIKSGLPEKAIQVNAYLGKENVVDPATGVSAAAQISCDKNVQAGQEVQITQYSQKGPSAILKVIKQTKDKILVGGTAVLFNYQII